MGPESAFQIINGTRQIGVGGIGTHDSDSLHGIKPQPPGKHVGGISQVIHDLKHLIPGLFTDIGIAVQYPGNGCNGYPRVFRDIVYIHKMTSHSVSAYKLSSLYIFRLNIAILFYFFIDLSPENE